MQYYCEDEYAGLFVIDRDMVYCCHCPKETSSTREAASIVLVASAMPKEKVECASCSLDFHSQHGQEAKGGYHHDVAARDAPTAPTGNFRWKLWSAIITQVHR